MNWIPLTEIETLSKIDKASYNHPVIIFKHSTRCSISISALDRVERKWNSLANPPEAYFLDLLNYRPISAEIATHYGVQHESPQWLLIENGKCIFHASHMAIQVSDLQYKLESVRN